MRDLDFGTSSKSIQSVTDLPPAKIYKKAQPVKESKFRWFLFGIAFVLMLTITIGLFAYIFAIRGNIHHVHNGTDFDAVLEKDTTTNGFKLGNGSESQKAGTKRSLWHEEKVCSAKCAREGYSKPPLVIFSFDGFMREYLDHPGWVKWLKKVGDCGVRAEKVFPVFPAKTFVNHYAIVTGQYPSKNGIVDNSFMDKKLSPKMIKMKNTEFNEVWNGEPLWSMYKRLAGGKANCYMFVGSPYDNHGNPCNTIKYNESVPFSERFEKIREWLLLPEEERPGLILSYFHEPDRTGHEKKYHKGRPEYGNTDLENKVKEMDNFVDKFMQQMEDDGLLNCANFAFLSDHGMASITEFVNADEIIKESDRDEVVGGAVSRFYADKSVVDKFLKKNTLNCSENNKHFLVSTDRNRPLRFHHANNHRIGDLVVEGRIGVQVEPLKYKKDFIGEHGYDYLQKDMQTTFFAMGPSLKRGTVLPPFQNVEYLNLWLDLLGIDPSKVNNDGTLGSMDDALVNPPPRNPVDHPEIQMCPNPVISSVCCAKGIPKCAAPNSVHSLFRHSPEHPFCYQMSNDFCGKTLLELNGKVTAVVEVIDKETLRTSDGCSVSVGKDPCKTPDGAVSISADRTVEISSLRRSFKGTFMPVVFSALEQFRDALFQRHTKAVVLSGTVVDTNNDGIPDADQSLPPTHFFRSFIFCLDNHWNFDGTSCGSPDQMDSRSFVFPTIPTDPNCLKESELLRYYSARLKDVEILTGLNFVPPGVEVKQLSLVRTRIHLDFFV